MGLIEGLLGSKCDWCGKRVKEPLSSYGALMVCPDCLKEIEEMKKKRLEEEERRRKEEETARIERAGDVMNAKTEALRRREEGDLFAAVSAGNLDACRRLLDAGRDANERDWSGKTPLCVAAYKNQPEIAALLIEKGADLNATNQQGWTPLHFAAASSMTDMVRLLIEKGAEKTMPNVQGKTPKSIAEEKSFEELARILS